MRLSEAIRKGCENSKQTFQEFVAIQKGELCACALGAAALAIQPDLNELSTDPVDIIFDNWPKELSTVVDSPVDNESCDLLENVIYDLNDKHYWTRERISDWLEQQGY